MATIRNITLTGTAREQFCAQVSRTTAADGMVLLKNENGLLPLEKEGGKYPIAVFGIGQIHTVKGGIGSGEVNNLRSVNILEGLTACGKLEVDRLVASKYEAFAASHQKKTANFMCPDVFSQEEMPISIVNVEAAAQRNDAAIIVISRIAGEGGDLKGEKGDYFLQDAEAEMIAEVCRCFDKTVLLLNTSGVMDTSFIDDRIKAVLYVSLPGQEGGHAVADVLCGNVSPSGCLTDTWARRIDDYPSYHNFGTARKNGNINKTQGPGPQGSAEQCDVFYEEGIYVGYRYFDTFGLDVKYPFGFGLTYADFTISACSLGVDNGEITVKATVLNSGEKYSGRRVLQVYFSAPEGRLEKPYQELVAFGKTGLLAPGESQELSMNFPITDMASFSERDLSYILESGYYFIRVGTGSRSTMVAGAVYIEKEIKTLILSDRMGGPYSPDFEALTKNEAKPISYPDEERELAAATRMAVRLGSKSFKHKTVRYRDSFKGCVAAGEGLTLNDVRAGTCTAANLVAQMSLEELAAFACGTGMDFTGFAEGVLPEGMAGMMGEPNKVPGAAGQTVDFTQNYGIRRIILADGPAGVRLTREIKNDEGEIVKRQNCTAFPVGTLLASGWDVEAVRSVGSAVAMEMLEYGVDLWLAPGMNIHRHPYCGRNFEYYSEDPRLTGDIGAAMTMGVQSRGVGVTIKHFAANNQENDRANSNSVVSQRALREIYLKGFERVVKTANPMAIMTSYNDINGIPSADNYDLCTAITRDEWGYKGMIMTDWGGGQSNPALSMYAGNDMIQPGGSASVQAILDGVSSDKPVESSGLAHKKMKVTRAMLEKSACNIIGVILRLPK